MDTDTSTRSDIAPSPAPGDPEVMDASRSWALLREAPFGRLGVVVDGRPQIFPVNHVVDHGTVLFRSASGTKVAAALGRPVVFEIDGYDTTSGEAWSVMVHGRAREVRDTDDVIDVMQAALFPWHAGPKPRFVRIVADSVTGRRYPVAGGARA